MREMRPYDQKTSDPSGFALSMAAIAGLLGLGLIFDGFTQLGCMLIAGALMLVVLSGRH